MAVRSRGCEVGLSVAHCRVPKPGTPYSHHQKLTPFLWHPLLRASGLLGLLILTHASHITCEYTHILYIQCTITLHTIATYMHIDTTTLFYFFYSTLVLFGTPAHTHTPFIFPTLVFIYVNFPPFKKSFASFF